MVVVSDTPGSEPQRERRVDLNVAQQEGALIEPLPPQPAHAALSAVHCSSLRSCSTRSMRRLRLRAALALRLPLTAIAPAYVAANLS
jgi:hypothetical protein